EEELTLRTNPVSTLLSSWIQSMKRMARTTVSILLLIPCTFLAADNPVEAVHRENQAQIQSYLKGHADLERHEGDGNRALHWAALNGNPVLLEQLIARGAAVNATNRVGATPLLYAVANLESVKTLLKAGADVNRASQIGTTPIVAAAAYPHSSEVVRLLLEHGAKLNMTQESRSVRDPLSVAAVNGDAETFKF